jgi:hypothetical protein
MKFVVSILAHEKPEIVSEQVANARHYLPGCEVVIHQLVKFDWGNMIFDFEKNLRVHVNPKSVPTFWGNLHHAHNSNFHYVSSKFEFDYFLLHSSSDLFVREGASDYISQYDCGVSFVPPQHTWGAPLFAEGDPVFQRIVKDSGAKELWCSQVEGTFYKKEVFAEMLKIIERHFDYRKTLPYVHEEIYYPTIASALNVKKGHPYLLREDKVNLPKFDSDLVDAIRSGELPDHHIKRWKLGREVDSLVWEGKHIYALRPIPRVFDNPLRTYIRKTTWWPAA